MKPPDFYSQQWQDSPLETATIQDVHYTLQKQPIPGSSSGQTQEVQQPSYSCKVVTDQGKVFDNVGWANLYLNPSSGAGIYLVPKILTRVILAFPKKGNPMILGFLSPVEIDGKHVSNRNVSSDEPMPQGSVMMKTDFGSKIHLIEGGVIRVQSTPICKRTMIPFGDQIRDFCRNYYLITSGGELTWTESTDGQRSTALRIEAFEKGGGKGRSVYTQMGTHMEGDPDPTIPDQKIFSFVVNANTQVYIGANGRIMIRNHQPDDGGEANDISIESDGKFTLSNVKDIEVNVTTGKLTLQAGAGTTLTMDPSGGVNIQSTMVTIKAQTVTLDAAVVQTTQQTLLGGGGLPVARLLDPVLVQTKDGPANGFITAGSVLTQSS